MGDRTTAYFTLGGKLTREAYDELLELIEQESYIQDNSFEDTDVREALVERKRFDIWIDEANYGSADPFPDFARRHGLPYHHSWASGGGYGPGGEIYDPATGETIEYAGLHDGGPCLPVTELKRMTHSEILQWIERVERPLPPLEFDF